MLSIVVPVFNEEESLQAFYDELMRVVPGLSKDYEVLFIDDGSIDKSLDILKQFERDNKHVRVYSFRRNMGKAEALTLGFHEAKGDLIVTLDADLQDQPSEIQKLLDVHKQGYDVVCGWRKDRKDKSKMKIISRLFNWTLDKVFDVDVHDYNCGLKLYSRDAAKSLRLYGGLHRFIPVLAYEQGFRVTEVAVHHEPRKFGYSKYGFSKVFRDLPDMFTMIFLIRYMKRPLHFFGGIGGILIVLGLVILGYLAILHFLGFAIGRRPLLLFGILAVLSGFQIFFTGFLAELLINLSHREERANFPIKYPATKSI